MNILDGLKATINTLKTKLDSFGIKTKKITEKASQNVGKDVFASMPYGTVPMYFGHDSSKTDLESEQRDKLIISLASEGVEKLREKIKNSPTITGDKQQIETAYFKDEEYVPKSKSFGVEDIKEKKIYNFYGNEEELDQIFNPYELAIMYIDLHSELLTDDFIDLTSREDVWERITGQRGKVFDLAFGVREEKRKTEREIEKLSEKFNYMTKAKDDKNIDKIKEIGLEIEKLKEHNKELASFPYKDVDKISRKLQPGQRTRTTKDKFSDNEKEIINKYGVQNFLMKAAIDYIDVQKKKYKRSQKFFDTKKRESVEELKEKLAENKTFSTDWINLFGRNTGLYEVYYNMLTLYDMMVVLEAMLEDAGNLGRIEEDIATINAEVNSFIDIIDQKGWFEEQIGSISGAYEEKIAHKENTNLLSDINFSAIEEIKRNSFINYQVKNIDKLAQKIQETYETYNKKYKISTEDASVEDKILDTKLEKIEIEQKTESFIKERLEKRKSELKESEEELKDKEDKIDEMVKWSNTELGSKIIEGASFEKKINDLTKVFNSIGLKIKAKKDPEKFEDIYDINLEKSVEELEAKKEDINKLKSELNILGQEYIDIKKEVEDIKKEINEIGEETSKEDNTKRLEEINTRLESLEQVAESGTNITGKKLIQVQDEINKIIDNITFSKKLQLNFYKRGIRELTKDTTKNPKDRVDQIRYWAQVSEVDPKDVQFLKDLWAGLDKRKIKPESVDTGKINTIVKTTIESLNKFKELYENWIKDVESIGLLEDVESIGYVVPAKLKEKLDEVKRLEKEIMSPSKLEASSTEEDSLFNYVWNIRHLKMDVESLLNDEKRDELKSNLTVAKNLLDYVRLGNNYAGDEVDVLDRFGIELNKLSEDTLKNFKEIFDAKYDDITKEMDALIINLGDNFNNAIVNSRLSLLEKIKEVWNRKDMTEAMKFYDADANNASIENIKTFFTEMPKNEKNNKIITKLLESGILDKIDEVFRSLGVENFNKAKEMFEEEKGTNLKFVDKHIEEQQKSSDIKDPKELELSGKIIDAFSKFRDALGGINIAEILSKVHDVFKKIEKLKNTTILDEVNEYVDKNLSPNQRSYVSDVINQKIKDEGISDIDIITHGTNFSKMSDALLDLYKNINSNKVYEDLSVKNVLASLEEAKEKATQEQKIIIKSTIDCVENIYKNMDSGEEIVELKEELGEHISKIVKLMAQTSIGDDERRREFFKKQRKEREKAKPERLKKEKELNKNQKALNLLEKSIQNLPTERGMIIKHTFESELEKLKNAPEGDYGMIDKCIEKMSNIIRGSKKLGDEDLRINIEKMKEIFINFVPTDNIDTILETSQFVWGDSPNINEELSKYYKEFKETLYRIISSALDLTPENIDSLKAELTIISPESIKPIIEEFLQGTENIYNQISQTNMYDLTSKIIDKIKEKFRGGELDQLIVKDAKQLDQYDVNKEIRDLKDEDMAPLRDIQGEADIDSKYLDDLMITNLDEASEYLSPSQIYLFAKYNIHTQPDFIAKIEGKNLNVEEIEALSNDEINELIELGRKAQAYSNLSGQNISIMDIRIKEGEKIAETLERGKRYFVSIISSMFPYLAVEYYQVKPEELDWDKLKEIIDEKRKSIDSQKESLQITPKAPPQTNRQHLESTKDVLGIFSDALRSLDINKESLKATKTKLPFFKSVKAENAKRISELELQKNDEIKAASLIPYTRGERAERKQKIEIIKKKYDDEIKEIKENEDKEYYKNRSEYELWDSYDNYEKKYKDLEKKGKWEELDKLKKEIETEYNISFVKENVLRVIEGIIEKSEDPNAIKKLENIKSTLMPSALGVKNREKIRDLQKKIEGGIEPLSKEEIKKFEKTNEKKYEPEDEQKKGLFQKRHRIIKEYINKEPDNRDINHLIREILEIIDKIDDDEKEDEKEKSLKELYLKLRETHLKLPPEEEFNLVEHIVSCIKKLIHEPLRRL